MTTSPPASPAPDESPGTVAAEQVIGALRAAGCVFAEDEATLLIDNADSAGHLAAMVRRRVGGEPLEYVLGWTEFCDLRIAVRPGVFVPRQRTALMVSEALRLDRADRRRSGRQGTVVLDLCCGAGAVGAALAARLPRCEVYAADIDPIAVACATQNLPCDAGTFVGDLYAPLPAALRGRVDLLVANAPYVPTDALEFMPPEARLHEPAAALDGGQNGLHIVKRVITDAPQWLSSGGHVLVESGADQAPAVAGLAADSGLHPRVATSDELGATVVIGTLPAR
jgi:release factor glutamine methyltransferase